MLWLFMRLNGWVAVFPAAIAALAFLAAALIGEDAARLDAGGAEATATIIGKQERQERSSTGSGTTTVLSVRYHFPIGGGRLHYGDRDVSRDFYDSVEYGVEVPIRYLPEDPDLHEIESGAVGENALWAGLVGAAFLLGALALVWMVVRQMRRLIAVRNHGKRAEATVDTVEVKSGNNQIRFSFTDETGTERKGHSLPGRRWRVAGIKVGERVPVRYDPQVAKSVYWERDLFPGGA